MRKPFHIDQTSFSFMRRALFTAAAGSSKPPLKASSLCRPRTSTCRLSPRLVISTMASALGEASPCVKRPGLMRRLRRRLALGFRRVFGRLDAHAAHAARRDVDHLQGEAVVER